ncbi:MAG: M20/M25/M40 family metallo-hydrolase [Gemmatimonas sp.]|nr:M20/M25/M40 family metallo-hydrolase [Gemmatimonas sp.]
MTRQLIILAASLAFVPSLAAQTWTVDDPVLQRIWEVGMEESRTPEIAQVLMDSLGPRLTGTPGLEAANDWSVDLIRSWGVDAEKQQYGTWIGWERGITHVDLIEPRVRTLEATLLAWSAGTSGPVEGPVVIVPDYQTSEELDAWIPTTRGKFVAIAFPQPTCRPDEHYEEYGTERALIRLNASRDSALGAFGLRVPSPPLLRIRLEEAGALGVLESNWSNAIGVNKIFSTNTGMIPTIDLSCEDYGLVWRLAENDQGPVLRVDAQGRFLGEVPVYNTIATIRGSELPDEYVMLSAHFDSWDGASGATDNGTGSTVMLEALRILSEAYASPRRTVILGLWGGEEQGLNGSRRFVADNPEIVENLQALFNQDVGTGRVNTISGQGLIGTGPALADYLSKIPPEITRHIELDLPGLPSAGGTDHAAFVCAGAPGINLSSVSWNYGTDTWHTNRDTYDKVVFEEIRNNAVLTAMLVYLASEDPDRLSRERRVMSQGPDGQLEWPTCSPGRASP